MMNKRLAYIISISAIVLVAVCVAAYSFLNAQYPKIAADNNGDMTVAVFPLDGGRVEVADSVWMKIDTGSSVSMLSAAAIDRLRSKGVTVKEEIFPSIARDVNDRMFMAGTRYRVDLPVEGLEFVADSVSGGHYVRTGKDICTIEDMVFLPAPQGQESVIGTDVLECFCVEIRRRDGLLAFHSDLPENYIKLARIESPSIMNTVIGCGKRYYVDLVTENVPNRYFIDTGIDKVPLKLPLGDSITANSRIAPAVYHSSRGEVDARFCKGAWVKIGNRAGSYKVFYATDGVEEYAMNPFAFFIQDVVFDFRNKGVYLRPTTDLAKVRY